MRPASFRASFYETLKDLTELSCGLSSCERAVWSVEYISRSSWFQFHGFTAPGNSNSAATLLDPLDGSIRSFDPAMLAFTLLDFHYNRVIGAYMGDERTAAQIASEIQRGLDCKPEVLSVSLARDDLLECGGQSRTTTCFAYVGFESRVQCEDIGSAKRLAETADAISAHWCRGRVRIFSVPVTGTSMFFGVR